jgi:hypothetical protein
MSFATGSERWPKGFEKFRGRMTGMQNSRPSRVRKILEDYSGELAWVLVEGRAFCAVSTKMALSWFAPVRLTGSPDEAGFVSDGGPSGLFPERFFVFQDAA